jgi:ATP-binding cassette subfamily B (MDR/TAP) protein 1
VSKSAKAKHKPHSNHYAAAIYPVQAVILARLTDVFNYKGEELVSKGNFYSLMFFVFSLGTGLVYFSLGWFSNVVSQKLTHHYRLEMFNAMLKQDIQFFDRAENTTGALSSKLTSQPTKLQELWGFNLSLILIVVVNITASSALALAYGWKLAVVVIFGGLPLLMGSGYVRMLVDHRMNEDTDKRFADSAALASEAVGAIRTVSSLALERVVLERYQEKVDKIVKVSLPSIMLAYFFFALSQSLEFLVLALGFWRVQK